MKRVVLLLCEGFEILEAAAFFDVLGWSMTYGSEKIEVETVGLSHEVTSAFGLRIVPDSVITEVAAEDFDALAIPGGFGDFGYYEDAYSEPVGDLIRSFHAAGKTIASICVGALPLAKSGGLAGRRATTYQLMDGRRRRQLAEFDVDVCEERVVVDGHIATSTGPETALDVAFWLLARLTDPDNVLRIRSLMGVGPTNSV